jgi:PKD repeat protein
MIGSPLLGSGLKIRVTTAFQPRWHWPLFTLIACSWCYSPTHLRADCTLTNLAITAINDLGSGFYKGYAGGLYKNGSNTRPSAHEAAGESIATNGIKSLSASGNVDTNSGRIVLLSIGMSNTTDEWASLGSETFSNLAGADLARNPEVKIVDGAQGGQDATTWTNPAAATWTTVLTRLTSAGVTTNQVQVLWLKQALAQVGNYGQFPLHAQALQNMLAMILRNAKAKYPNLRLAYLSCRTRCYTDVPTALNPEPFAFETGFADKWVIQDQIDGLNNLNFEPTNGPVVAPWISWGPYIWTDGTRGRSDGLTSVCPDDLQSDFTHPSATGGVPKVARQLLAFFKTDPTAAPWFVRKTTTPPTLSISASPTNGTAPLRVNFTAMASSTHGAVTNFVWTYDDGDFANVQNPVKGFPAPGLYQVHVTVEDIAGNAVTAAIAVNVTAPPFAFTSVARQTNNVALTWNTSGGQSYVVQAATNLAGAQTNFADISPLIPAPGAAVSSTSYLDPGVLSNKPVRFYRVRVGP